MELLVSMLFLWASWAPQNFGKNLGSMYARIKFGFTRGYNKTKTEI